MDQSMTPREIVAELDRYIIGQDQAKRAVAIALRDRWRRMQLPEDLRSEVTPKNILMIGPTGVGKTEIARRIARLANAPFIKVEATKFTEVGYVGREVDSIIRDLVEAAVKGTRKQALDAVRAQARERAEERLLDALLPPSSRTNVGFVNEPVEVSPSHSDTRAKLRNLLHEGKLDERDIDIEITSAPTGFEIMAPPGMEEMTGQLENMLRGMSSQRREKRRVKVQDAKGLLEEDEAAKLINDDDIKSEAVRQCEQNGIVFIDEIDKLARRAGDNASADISREGVQRDLLPLVEGSTVNTRYGMVRTDHILFIASGAFHVSKPSDLIPELQGRLPIRVELNALTTNDFVRILTEPKASLTAQYVALLQTEGLRLTFTEDGVRRVAELAHRLNERTENIGARRLHTALQRLLEDISFIAPDRSGAELIVDSEYVDGQLSGLVEDEDLSRYIL